MSNRSSTAGSSAIVFGVPQYDNKWHDRKAAIRFLETGYRVVDEVGREVRMKSAPDGEKRLYVVSEKKLTRPPPTPRLKPTRTYDEFAMLSHADADGAAVDFTTVSGLVLVPSYDDALHDRSEAASFIEKGFTVTDNYGHRVVITTAKDGSKKLDLTPATTMRADGTFTHNDAPFPDRFADPFVTPGTSTTVDANVDYSTISRRVLVHSQFAAPVEIERSHAANSLMLGYTITDQYGYDLTIETLEDGSKRVIRTEDLPKIDNQWKGTSHDVYDCQIVTCEHPSHFPAPLDLRKYGSEVAGAASRSKDAGVIQADDVKTRKMSFMKRPVEGDAMAANSVAKFHHFGNSFRQQVSDRNLEQARISLNSSPTASLTLGGPPPTVSWANTTGAKVASIKAEDAKANNTKVQGVEATKVKTVLAKLPTMGVAAKSGELYGGWLFPVKPADAAGGQPKQRSSTEEAAELVALSKTVAEAKDVVEIEEGFQAIILTEEMESKSDVHRNGEDTQDSDWEDVGPQHEFAATENGKDEVWAKPKASGKSSWTLW